MAIVEASGIAIRKMEGNERDLGLFLGWMTDPETMRYWDGMTVRYTPEMAAEHYYDGVAEGVQQCIIEYGGRAIGFCQFDRLTAEAYEVPAEEYDKYVKPGETAYGVDIFIGETDIRDRGIGTRIMVLLTGALFEKYGADAVLIDPKVHNARAIRCYEKAGFKRLFTVPGREEQDGVFHDSLIMGLRRDGAGGYEGK